jgi:hypothetical protein
MAVARLRSGENIPGVPSEPSEERSAALASSAVEPQVRAWPYECSPLLNPAARGDTLGLVSYGAT